jgi:hypothetical protein
MLSAGSSLCFVVVVVIVVVVTIEICNSCSMQSFLGLLNDIAIAYSLALALALALALRFLAF